jgi:PhnB protein
MPNPIPQGFHTVTPGLTLKGCAAALDFYRRALGAEEIVRMMSPDGKAVMHAEIRVGDSILMLNDEMPGMGGPAAPSADRPSPVNLWLYVADCDAAYQRAVAAGARSLAAPTDMFWGDRVGMVRDPFGYGWNFSTHVKDMTPEEMKRAGEEFMKSWKPPGR